MPSSSNDSSSPEKPTTVAEVVVPHHRPIFGSLPDALALNKPLVEFCFRTTDRLNGTSSVGEAHTVMCQGPL